MPGLSWGTRLKTTARASFNTYAQRKKFYFPAFNVPLRPAEV